MARIRRNSQNDEEKEAREQREATRIKIPDTENRKAFALIRVIRGQICFALSYPHLPAVGLAKAGNPRFSLF